MNIVIFGMTMSSSWGNGHATLWRGLCGSLARLGVRTVFFERDVPYYACARDGYRMPNGELIVYQDWDSVRSIARQECLDADIAIVTSYCLDAVAATELMVDCPSLGRVFYDLDAPVTLECIEQGREVFYLPQTGLAEFDLVLSFTGGGVLDELRTRLGARRVSPLYGHVDPKLHRPVLHRRDARAHLSYLGTFAADRQAALERLFIEPARRRPTQSFVLGGAQYPDDVSLSKNVRHLKHVAPTAHAEFFSTSRCTLNITRAAMARMGWCPSGRIFEAAACGAVVLSDPWPGIESFYEPSREILLVRETEDVLQAIDLSDAELSRIARAARERTLSEYTSLHRARELIDLCSRVGSSGQVSTARPEAAVAGDK